MAKKKFTFKNETKRTGLAAVGYGKVGADIKLNSLECGCILAPNWSTTENTYKVYFRVKQEDGGWKLVYLQKRTSTLEEMKEWLKEQTEAIVEKYDLYFFPKDE